MYVCLFVYMHVRTCVSRHACQYQCLYPMVHDGPSAFMNGFIRIHSAATAAGGCCCCHCHCHCRCVAVVVGVVVVVVVAVAVAVVVAAAVVVTVVVMLVLVCVIVNVCVLVVVLLSALVSALARKFTRFYMKCRLSGPPKTGRPLNELGSKLTRCKAARATNLQPWPQPYHLRLRPL